MPHWRSAGKPALIHNVFRYALALCAGGGVSVALAAGVDPSELAAPDKIPSVARDWSAEIEDSEEQEARSPESQETPTAGEPDKKWPTPLPQKMNIGKDEEARRHLSEKNWAEASIILKSILEERPQSLSASLDLARALTYLGRREEGLQVLVQLAASSEGKKRATVIRRLRVLSELFRTNETYLVYQEGVNMLRAGRAKAARERFTQVLRKEPGNVPVMLRLGQCLSVEDDHSGAVEQLQAAAKLNPFEPEVRLWLGRALMRTGEREQALAALESAQRELPESELAPRWYAEALLLAGRRERALEVLKSDVEQNPLHLLSLLALAEARYARNGTAAASSWEVKRDLQVAISRLPDYAERRSRGPRSGLEYTPYAVDSIRKDIDSLLSQVESQLRTESN